MPLLIAAAAITFRPFARVMTVLMVIVLIDLHWRFNRADLRFRSRGAEAFPGQGYPLSSEERLR